MIAALCVAPAVSRALAQEGAPAAGGADAPAPPPAGGHTSDDAVKGPDGVETNRAETNRNVDQVVAPRHGAAGLWRRANMKTLIANASSANAAGGLGANTRIGPQPHPFDVPRNAVGAVLPAARPSVTAGIRPLGVGTVAVNVGNHTTQAHAPANAGQALRGAALNGTTMNRAAMQPGYIGGPAKDHTGINGTLMRPRY
jgi:hypothetical protein